MKTKKRRDSKTLRRLARSHGETGIENMHPRIDADERVGDDDDDADEEEQEDDKRR